MIQAAFSKGDLGLQGVTVSGHAGTAPAGQDILCAAVSSAVQMTANGVTEVEERSAQVEVEENRVSIALAAGESSPFLEALRLHLELLRQDYPQSIQITVSEV